MTTTEQSRRPKHDAASSAAAAVAVRHLEAHGFERTTAGELADAIGMSRSTFFRRFGSKEDVVFADHDAALSDLEAHLQHSTARPGAAVTDGALGVMQRLIRDPEAARARSELLRHTPSLRERELVITHRYERVFASYLEGKAAPRTPHWVPIGLAAAVVAVHNAALRRWLREEHARALSGLERELTELTALFSPWFGGADHASRVVVATFDAGQAPDAVMRAIAESLGADGTN